ncbi:hypothetical protein [Pseudonocardia hydrocarbonoxydans]|uniref:Translation initiation factor IF-2 N-terminal domain-containing protein n=1 Tax=Pseudonocardia hydrocarbonoxydans TaxID=76726 RepID=A0A4Y3WVV2_9PSEU|nr:hypothetical protein [Pseudonocardia hydrocarbonoxydans]GEC21859.1 hypothetical protein PHY01_41420 [Pseudonocardia hydrocarbonoxydans]
MEIEKEDRVPLWHLARNTGMPKRELLPLLAEIGMTVEADLTTGDVYASRSEFGDLLRSVAEGAV